MRGSSSGKTAFGVAGLSLENGSKVDDQPPAALQEHLKKALSIRVFYSTRNGITSSNGKLTFRLLLSHFGLTSSLLTLRSLSLCCSREDACTF